MRKMIIVLFILSAISCAKKDDLELSVSRTKLAYEDAWVLKYTLSNHSKQEYALASDFILQQKDIDTDEWVATAIELSYVPIPINLPKRSSYSGEIHGEQLVPRLARGTYRLCKDIIGSDGRIFTLTSEEFTVE